MRWVFRLLSVLASAMSLSALTSPVAAQAPREPFLRVTRDAGAETCPDEAALLAHVEQVRGHRATGEDSTYHVTFTRRAGEFRASIQVGAGSVRVLRDRGESCESLDQATAVTLALLLDAGDRAPNAELDTTPPTKPAPPPAALPERAPHEEEHPSRRAVITLGVGGGPTFGISRVAAPLLLGDLGIGVGRFRTTVGVLWMPTQRLELGPGRLDERLLGAVARTCLAPWRSSSLRLDLCSGVYAGIVRVSASGYTRNDEAEKAWLSVPLEVSLSTRSAPVGLEGGVSALVPLRRHDFSIDHLGVARESWPVGMLVSLRALGVWLL